VACDVGVRETISHQSETTVRIDCSSCDYRCTVRKCNVHGCGWNRTSVILPLCLGAIQVQAVENYLSSSGFSNVTVADNQLFIEADGTAANVQAAFNTPLVQYSVNGTTVYVNATNAQVPHHFQALSAPSLD
jgi:hypothetical protein